jgi:protein TonB
MSVLVTGPGFAAIDRRDRVSVFLSVGVHVLFAIGLVLLAGTAAKHYEEVEMALARTHRAQEPPPPPPAPPEAKQANQNARARLTRRVAKQAPTPTTPQPVIDPGPPVAGASDDAMPALAAPPPVDPNASADGVLGGTGNAAPAVATNRVYDMGDLDSLPTVVGTCNAEYPAFARQTRQAGFVMLQFTLDESGHVQSPRVRASQPPGVFDQAALDGIRRCRYSVPKVGGHPVSVTFRHRMSFRLE